MFNFKNGQTCTARLAVHGLGFGLLALTAALFVFAVHRPLARARADHLQRSEQLAALLEGSGEVRRQNTALRQELKALNEQVQDVRARVPAYAEDGAFISQLAAAAEDEGVQLIDYRRGRAVETSAHSHIELDLKCVGTYAALCRFLNRVESLPRVTNVSQFALQSIDDREKYPFEIGLVLYFGLHPTQTAEVANGTSGDAS